jgi:hypothetical protein
VPLRASASQTRHFFALDFEHQLDGFNQALQAFSLRAALAIGAGHLRAEGGEPFAVPLHDCGVAISHDEKLFLSKRADNLKTRVGALIVLAFLLAACASGQQYTIDWFTIDGGGGTSTGGVYVISGTIGQPDANAQPMTGGNYSLVGGFWSLFAVQMPGAPLLTITLNPQLSTITVSWPSPSTGFTLQQNADLGTTNWVTAPQTVSDSGTDKFIIVNPPAGNRFYRLFKPE